MATYDDLPNIYGLTVKSSTFERNTLLTLISVTEQLYDEKQQGSIDVTSISQFYCLLRPILFVCYGRNFNVSNSNHLGLFYWFPGQYDKSIPLSAADWTHASALTAFSADKVSFLLAGGLQCFLCSTNTGLKDEAKCDCRDVVEHAGDEHMRELEAHPRPIFYLHPWDGEHDARLLS